MQTLETSLGITHLNSVKITQGPSRPFILIKQLLHICKEIVIVLCKLEYLQRTMGFQGSQQPALLSWHLEKQSH